MISTDYAAKRWREALAAINSKQEQMTGSVTNSQMSARQKADSFIGGILMSLSAKGGDIEPETFIRTFSFIIMAARSYSLELSDGIDCRQMLDMDELDFFSRMRMPQLVAQSAASLAPAVEADDEDSIRREMQVALTSVAYLMTLFCVMHNMPEQEYISGIPDHIDIRL